MHTNPIVSWIGHRGVASWDVFFRQPGRRLWAKETSRHTPATAPLFTSGSMEYRFISMIADFRLRHRLTLELNIRFTTAAALSGPPFAIYSTSKEWNLYARKIVWSSRCWVIVVECAVSAEAVQIIRLYVTVLRLLLFSMDKNVCNWRKCRLSLAYTSFIIIVFYHPLTWNHVE